MQYVFNNKISLWGIGRVCLGVIGPCLRTAELSKTSGRKLNSLL